MKEGVAQKIVVSVKPNAKSPGVLQLSDRDFRVSVCEPARDGKANGAAIELLARHFGVTQSRIKILRGRSSRHKIIQIL